MNCQEALNLLYEVIDKEASQIDVKEVQKHLDRCQDCLKKFQVEESLQALVNEKLKAASDIPKIDNLKERVLLQLEQIDIVQVASREKSFPFRIPLVALAAAASVILLVGAAYWGKGLYDHYTEYIPLERAHWAAAGDVNGFGDQNGTQAVLAAVGGDFSLTFLDSFSGLSLVGARTEEIKGQKVPHLVYHDGRQTVSVFVFASDKMALPDDLIKTRIDIDGRSYFDHNCRGCRMVYHGEGEALIVTASTGRSVELLEFNPVIAAL